jgi:outer membrane scaffolding protein for murein synthesis (MipA/OmpV family)
MYPFRRLLAATLLCILLFIPCSSRADSADKPTAASPEAEALPLWELGLFGFYLRLPQYRGSDQYSTYIFPLPFVIYRGGLFQSTRDGLKGIFTRSENFEANVSFYGNPPVDDDNRAREGMDELDPVFEAGPALKWYFFGRHPTRSIHLRAAARAVTAVDIPNLLDWRYVGVHGDLYLIYRNRSLWNSLWEWGFNTGFDFTDSSYNNYFYGVPEEAVLPEREAYDADGGYAGFMVSTMLARRIPGFGKILAYVRWENVDGAVFEDSPLVKENNNFTVGLTVEWMLFTSKTKVDPRYVDE